MNSANISHHRDADDRHWVVFQVPGEFGSRRAIQTQFVSSCQQMREDANMKTDRPYSVTVQTVGGADCQHWFRFHREEDAARFFNMITRQD
jgi:hypothetical protein